MTSNDTPIKPSKVFNWSDTSKAKPEFTTFMATFRVTLGSKSWVLSEEQSALFKPAPFLLEEPENNHHNRHDKWLIEEEKHAEKTRKYMLDILYAGNCLRACLQYPSMARSEVDQELDKPSTVPGQSAIEVNFRAAMALLKEKYSANTTTDIDTLRSELQAMND